MEVEENRTEEQNLNFADDTGELDYEPSEPDNSIKDAASVEVREFSDPVVNGFRFVIRRMKTKAFGPPLDTPTMIWKKGKWTKWKTAKLRKTTTTTPSAPKTVRVFI